MVCDYGACTQYYLALYMYIEDCKGLMVSALIVSQRTGSLNIYYSSSCKAFYMWCGFTHAGLGGLQEALYNGHPVITIPTSGDQWANAVRVQHYKLGVYLHPCEVNAEKITEAIETISGEEFTGSVAKLQKIFLHAGGAERAADLVEFYEDVGYDHLVPAYAKYEWNWIQYYNVDVYALMLCIVLLCMYSTCRLCFCVCRRCVRSKEKKD